MGTKLGDVNLDGRVDVDDLNILGIHWQGDATSWSEGDFNGDGKVEVEDLNLIGIHWQYGLAAPAFIPRAALAIGLGSSLLSSSRHAADSPAPRTESAQQQSLPTNQQGLLTYRKSLETRRNDVRNRRNYATNRPAITDAFGIDAVKNDAVKNDAVEPTKLSCEELGFCDSLYLLMCQHCI